MLRYLLNLFQKRKMEKKGKGVIISELEITPTQKIKKTKPSSPVKKEERKEIDEVKLFIEVVNNLRLYAALPPVEEKKVETKPPTIPPPAPEKPPTEVIPPAPSEKVKKEEVPAAKPSSPPTKKALSKAEIEKIIKVAFSHLERALMNMVEDKMRAEGRISFKEMAMARRKVRNYLKDAAEPIVDKMMREIKDGRDPRDEKFIQSLAKVIYNDIFGENKTKVTQKPVEDKKEEEKGEKKEEKKEEEDILTLLGEEKKEEKRKEEEDVEDILKLLES